jgi:hypothetical protein
MTLPPLVVALSFGLAAMAPVVAVTLVVLAANPRWRALGAWGLIVALGAGAGCFLVFFAVSSAAQPLDLRSGLVAFGAGLSFGGAVVCLWAVARRKLSGGRAV